MREGHLAASVLIWDSRLRVGQEVSFTLLGTVETHRTVEVLPARGGRRRWPDEVKARIVAENAGEPPLTMANRRLRIIIRCATSYRQGQIYARSGVELDRSTLAGWVGKAAFHLGPVYDRLKGALKTSSTLGLDETTVRVLDPGRGKTKTGRVGGRRTLP